MSDPRDRQETPAHDPWDIDLEQSVLGCLLREASQIDIAIADLTAADFWDPLHGRIFDYILALHSDGDAATPVVLHSVMKTDPGIIETGGRQYLDALWGAAPAIPEMRTYIKQLKELALRRQLLSIAEALRASALSPDATGQQTAEMATEGLLAAGRVTARPILTIRQIAEESIREAEGLKLGKSLPLVKTGIDKLDKELGGLRGGDMLVVMGKSGMGKSALMGGISRYTAQHGTPTIVFSLEMTRRQWIERLICDLEFENTPKSHAPMSYNRIRNGRLNNDEFDRFVLGSQRTEGWPFEIHDDDTLTIVQMSAIARAFAAKHKGKTGVVVLDYLQIVQPADERENRERQVARIARGAKALAKRLDWPVIAGSQMNEGDAARSKEEKRPQASDARESRAIMNEADQMLAPWRPAYFVERRKPMDSTPGDVSWNTWAGELREVRHRFELLCLKNRHGRTFDLELYCDMSASAIRDEPPYEQSSTEEQAARDLLTEVGQ